ncbi:DUF6962 family protein [Simiduia agarivorans]|uniref:Uncharacterized protein n=1 Tax=Simiduia agarivorans (strain DSM 21679 / JCM 13881 / BCRC 17597 / SA1) TaxID=1117647 RepID=K4KPW8_SIMAS|nr:hypothetical protein [Simiduia agarivorans]AFV00301.1 hypothetical protein M5M_15840 [Simiduia agarivorans SA1 = DSM 21679]
MWVDSLTELTTAATDLLLALMALALAVFYRHHGNWSRVFGLLALGAGLGAVAHGLALPVGAITACWLVIYAALALLVAQFALIVIQDLWGPAAVRRATLPLLALAAGFWLYTSFVGDSFLPFIVYEVLAMGFALAGFSWQAWQRRAGAGWLVLGVLLTLVAAAVQALKLFTFTLIWPFDHNGVYHLIQMVALVPFWLGVRRLPVQR